MKKDTLDIDYQAFIRDLPNLLEEHRGKYSAYFNGKLVCIDETKETTSERAISELKSRNLYGIIMVQQIVPKEEMRTVGFASPRSLSQKIMSGLVLFSLVLLSLNLASALIVDDLSQGDLFPGEQTSLSIDIKNTLGDDFDDVSLRLDLSGTQFITVGSSEQSVDRIREDDTESFDFNIKASQDIKPGDYNLPYTISYNNGSARLERKGTIGITVGARTELDYSIKTENPVIGQKGKVTLIVTNKGFGDIKFVSVKIEPSGFNLLSSDSIYVGTVSSDDFETAVYDITFKDKNARLIASVDYRDFDNKKITQNINLPIKVYTKEEAIQEGIIKPDNTLTYVVVLVVIVAIFFLWRIYRLRKRKKNNKGA